MPAETCYHVMELLSDPLGPEWEASRQIIEHENRENSSRACGLRGRPDLRPKISAKQKRPITVRNRPLDLQHMFNASRLDVQIPADIPSTSSANATTSNTAKEHSLEVSTPISITPIVPAQPPPHQKLLIMFQGRSCEKPRPEEYLCQKQKEKKILRPKGAIPLPRNREKVKRCHETRQLMLTFVANLLLTLEQCC